MEELTEQQKEINRRTSKYASRLEKLIAKNKEKAYTPRKITYKNNKVQSIIETRKLLHKSFNTAEGVIKLNAHNTLTHELAKFFLGWEAHLQEPMVTEAIFENGKTADVLLLVSGEAREVTKSETKKSIENKRKTYPVPVIELTADKVIEHYFERWVKGRLG